MIATDQPNLRWYDYVFAKGDESDALIHDATRPDGRTLLVCGAGFDPRTLDVPQRVAVKARGDVTVVAMAPVAAGEHDGAEESARENATQLEKLFGPRLTLFPPPAVEDPSTLGTVLARELGKRFKVLDFDTVIVDMSGLPSSMSFPVIQLLLIQSMPDSAGRPFNGNLLVTVSEDASTDARIVATGLGPAGIMSSFTRLDDKKQNIWVPVLGKNSTEELKALVTLLRPDEVCPVVPFPSVDPLRADDLLVEHRTLLFDELRFEPRNVLYASESNPFDLYRQLVWLADRYRIALKPLGGATIIVSEHASKVLSLGALLAAHEADIAVGYVRPMSYRLEPDTGATRTPRIHTAWLTGQPYEEMSAA
ncbi:hypothetical protein [Frigoribacterium sp. PhB116]|uniref:hypothetical protein n=1 Tax=Frigoribacterium sp. PhB116 TaxID=2485174 RepID=UPI0010D79FB9|nr:hypothetical protein [Frigoribacterium sp. PhB116]TDT65255.1 hypothetical protein EDF20_0034 [Frigoribacterium sp. PhB116]